MERLKAAISRREVKYFLGGIFFLAFLVYGRSLFNDFVYWDDPLLIMEHPVSQGLTFHNIARAFSIYDPELYVPLTFLSYQLNYAVAGLHPFFYHLTNLLLHAGSAALVGWVVVLLAGSKRTALFAALLFLVHPINVEAVAWASARKDVLASFFFLLSLGTYLRCDERVDRKWLAISLLAYLPGLLSKASILVLPPILLLSDWYRGRLRRASVLRNLPYAALSVVFGVVALYGKTGGDRMLWEKFLLGMKGTIFSLTHLSLPFGYSVIYPYNQTIAVENPDLLLPLLAVAGISVLTILLRRRLPTVAFAWWFFLLLLVPSFLTVEKGGDRVRDLYFTSDRYAYLASIGVFLALALACDRLRTRREQLPVMLASCVLGFFGVLSYRQSLVWRDTGTLFRHALVWYPDSYIAHNNLGAFYEAQGDPERALAEYTLSVRMKSNGFGWFNLGQIAMKSGRPQEAIEYFTKAVQLRPSHHIAQLNLGGLLLESGKPAEAIPYLLKAQSIDPTNVVTYLDLGLALEQVGNTVDAIRAFERALQAEPGNPVAEEQLNKLRR